jgi:hypothetical protein
MFRHKGRYYLSYSHGRTDQDSYQVHYAIGDSPFGPFREPSPAPLLATTPDREVLSPGHHAFFRYQGQPYILYHRQALPFVPKGPILRQLCVDPLSFNADGTLSPVKPSHQPPSWIHRQAPALSATLSASSQADEDFGAAAAGDDNYATRWLPGPDDQAPWLQLDFGSVRALPATQLRFEYAWKPYAFRVEASEDGHTWTLLANHLHSPVAGSPLLIPGGARARFLRLSFPPAQQQATGLLEWECSDR